MLGYVGNPRPGQGRGNLARHSRRNGPTGPDGYAGGPAAVRVAMASLRGYKQVNKHGVEFRAHGDVGRTSQACRNA